MLDGTVVRRFLIGRQAHDVGSGFLGAIRTGLAESYLVHDVQYASSTQRAAAHPAEGVTFRDSRGSTPPSRVVPGIKRTVMTPQRHADLATAAAPAPESVPHRSERFAKIPAAPRESEFPAYPPSKRLEASFSTPNAEAVAVNEPWSRARMERAPTGLELK